MPAGMKERQREGLAEVDVDWLIAERRQVKTRSSIPPEQNGHQHQIHESQHPYKCVEHAFSIMYKRFGFVKARYKGLLKTINQLAMLFTPANWLKSNDTSVRDLSKNRK